LKLGSLRALVVAIDEGSLRSASRRLGVSQPSLTKMIRELEAELSTSLVVRSTRGVVGTAQGMVLYQRAKAADRELSNAVEQIRQLGGTMSGTLTIAAVPLAVLVLIPETLRTFSNEFPQVQIQVLEELYIEQLSRLRKGEVDVAIGPIPENLSHGEFVVEPLMPIDMVIVVRKNHELARARRLSDLSDASWVYTGDGGISGYAKAYFERAGLQPPRAGAVVNSTLGLLSIIATGSHLCLMPRQMAVHPMALPYLDIIDVDEGPLSLQLGALARFEMSIKPSVRHLMAHLHRAARPFST
jgi:LysR family transcriptional regulator, regulator of abg operon